LSYSSAIFVSSNSICKHVNYFCSSRVATVEELDQRYLLMPAKVNAMAHPLWHVQRSTLSTVVFHRSRTATWCTSWSSCMMRRRKPLYFSHTHAGNCRSERSLFGDGSIVSYKNSNHVCCWLAFVTCPVKSWVRMAVNMVGTSLLPLLP